MLFRSSFLETENISYIVGARLKSMSSTFKDQMFNNNFDKNPTSDIICDIKVNQTVKQRRLIVNYSEKRAKKDCSNRDRSIKKLNDKIEAKQTVIRKNKYLLTEQQGAVIGLNQDKIDLDKLYDGLKRILDKS